VQSHHASSVTGMIFLDGVAEPDGLGMGTCAVALLPFGTENTERVTIEVFNMLTDNVQPEVRGIVTVDLVLNTDIQLTAISMS